MTNLFHEGDGSEVQSALVSGMDWAKDC